MAFRKKAEFILTHKPDILIIPECEHPDKFKFTDDGLIPNDIVWHGSNQNKGLGVFSYSNYRFRLLDIHHTGYKNILPIAVTGGKLDFTLFAIWANNPQDTKHVYIGQVWKALHHYDKLLDNGPVILTGDFNSNTIWDKPKREGNHSAVVNLLEKKDIYSAYHKYSGSIQGKENHSTQYMYRHENKPYHLDYCFASSYFTDRIEMVEIGNYADWVKYSDHTPLSVKFNL